jgi:hypothetical protein
MTEPLRWRDLPASARTLARWLTIVQLVGYTTSLVFVWNTTRLAPGGIVSRYRGSDPNPNDATMHFAKSFAEMLTLTHTHLLAMAAIFAFGGAALSLCSKPGETAKRWLIAEPFGALLISFASMWLMRYADPHFAWLLEASSTLMAVTFYVQAALILADLHRSDRQSS